MTTVAITNGEEQSRGVELDSNIKFSDGLSMIFNYSHQFDAEGTEGVRKGNDLRNTPENSAN